MTGSSLFSANKILLYNVRNICSDAWQCSLARGSSAKKLNDCLNKENFGHEFRSPSSILCDKKIVLLPEC